MRKLGFVSAGLALLVTLGAREAAAQPSGFTRANGIGVNNANGSALSNYQVRLVVNTQALISAGQMRADANDMVFTLGQCGAAVLPHWIESGVNTTNTIVWVKVPSLAVGVTRLTMWFSNAGAAATGNVSRVFIGEGAANDPISWTGQVISPTVGTADDTQRGFRFSPNVPILVVEFGKREPNGVAKIVTLFDFASTSIVRQGTVAAGTAGAYNYTATSPFWLNAGQQYLLEIYGRPGESYYFGTSSQIAPDLTYLDMRYCNSCNQNTFPTSILAGYHYGNPDLRYYKRLTSTPEPNQVGVTGACAQSASCDVNCTAAACGDGYVNANANEVCDDGNTANTDACAACQNARCGDGYIRAGSEQCDDGNTVDTDACRNSCQTARCGDGVIQAGTDQCDDGNSTDTDGCRNNCQSARCGDGVVYAGVEQCDDGNSTDTDACRNNCTNNTGMGGAGGMSGSGGSAGASTGGASGASTGGRGGTSTGGRGGTSTGGRGGTSAGTNGGGEGGEAGGGDVGGEAGESSGGTTATGGRATGGRGGTATGGKATGGTSAPGGEGGEGNAKGDDEETFDREDPGCGCTTPGSQSNGRTAAVLALLGLGWVARARRRGSRRSR